VSAKHIAVIDYGMGNLHSVASALARVAPEAKVIITNEAEQIESADHIVFPGVGAIRDCIAEIKRFGCDRAVAKAYQDQKPILAICVGMQSLMQRSEENNGVACLGMLPGQVKFFSGNPQFCAVSDESSPSNERLKVPHMGWNQVEQMTAHPLWHDIPQGSRFYFVHSYYVETADSRLQTGRTHFGITFTAAIAENNLFAVQFHPEKSHTCGLQLLHNFICWDGSSPSLSETS